MRKTIAALALVAILHGCAGAQFALPQLSDAEISRTALAISGDTSGLQRHARTDQEYRELLQRVSNRLRLAAPPLCTHAGVSSCYFNVHYVGEDVVNAYASAGNEIVVYRGLLQYLETEDEIAAAVSHEIGHHLAEHIEEKQENALVGSILAGVLMGALLAATGTQSPSYDPEANQRLVRDSMQIGAAVGALSYSKEQEREADLLGAYLLARAGYDLRKAGQLYDILARMNRERTHSGWFDTHPAGPERIVAWEKAVAEVEASPDKLPREE
ncbi:MAG: M48 family metalloprotease [Alphaproteobacteria bacterium]